jgi:Ca2+-binding RTX toxin-like protein
MRAAFRCALVVSAILLIEAPVAAANTAVSFVNGYVDVQTDAAGSNITIAKTGAGTFSVTDPAGNLTGAGPNCTPAGPTATVTCQNITQGILVAGKGGDDKVAAAPGVDLGVHFFGNNGNDTLTGGDALDELDGGMGDDTLNGGAGGDSYLKPGFGSDHVNGGSGADRIEQQSTTGDTDVLNGDGDDDFIWSQGSGEAQLNGGQGEDIIAHSNFEIPGIVISGGDGEDEVALGSSFDVGIAVSLDDQANDGPLTGGTSNVHSDIETINTGPGPDVIVGSPGPNLIRSDVRRDSWFVLDSAGGNDTIDPGGGVDDVFSGGGDDNITATDHLGDRINCGSNQPSPPDSDTATGDAIDTFFACENVNAIPLPVVDTTDPAVTLKAPRSISRRAFARKGLVVRLSADEAASFAVDLNAKVKRRGGALVFPAAVGEATLGTKRMKLGTGTRSLRLKPSRRFAASVRNRRLRLVVRVTARDAAGNVTQAARSVRVK